MTGPIARGTIRTSAVLGLRLVVQAGTLLLVARMLGPDAFGAFAGVAALAVILGALSTFGTHVVLLRAVSTDPVRRDAVLSWAIPTTLIGGAVVLACYLLLGKFALQEAGVVWSVLLTIGVTEAWLQPLARLFTVEHHGAGRIAYSQALTTVPLALRLAAAIAVFLLKPAEPLAAYGYGYLAASVLALVVIAPTVPSPWPATRHWRLPALADLRESIGYAALNITAAGPAELDKTLAAKLLPLGVAGVYSAGARVIGAVTLPVTAMMLSALPRLFREGQDASSRTTRLLRWLAGAPFAYGFALAIALWFAAPVFDWIFGASYRDLDQTLRWLCLAVPGMSLRVAAGSLLMALGKPWMRVGFEAGGVGLLILAALLLTRSLGATGMPLALAASEWTMAVAGWAYVYHARSTRPSGHAAAG